MIKSFPFFLEPFMAAWLDYVLHWFETPTQKLERLAKEADVIAKHLARKHERLEEDLEEEEIAARNAARAHNRIVQETHVRHAAAIRKRLLLLEADLKTMQDLASGTRHTSVQLQQQDIVNETTKALGRACRLINQADFTVLIQNFGNAQELMKARTEMMRDMTQDVIDDNVDDMAAEEDPEVTEQVEAMLELEALNSGGSAATPTKQVAALKEARSTLSEPAARK